MLVDTSVTIYNGSTPIDYVYQGSTLLWQREQPTGQPNNEIWYTPKYTSPITMPYTADTYWGATLISNTYSEGKGILKFSGNVTKINKPYGTGMFEDRVITSISLPDTILTLGNKTFRVENRASSMLTSIKLPSNLQSIGNNCFTYNAKISTITLPSTLTSIGQYAFSYCLFDSFNYEGTMAQWVNISLGNLWKLDSNITVVHCSDGDVTL